ncbi:hypothetical protein CLV56_2074 [Mumia flava]|uniref:YCII-related domain-containing protein n=1 Tax=Mumia flava TaxID=1348852 RepID=A0A0B2B7Q0_9ACTN|nr:YciI family protein [Mumia flava]PJJ57836.1 hypothetical protein CLV56_2074 [Mumia flava]
MRYFTLLEATAPDGPPPAELMEAIAALGAEAGQAGSLVDFAGLTPSAFGARVDVDGDGLSITDGPFAESKELVSYALYDVRTKEEAVEWARRFMQLHVDHWPGWVGTTKVVKVFGPEDVPPAG